MANGLLKRGAVWHFDFYFRRQRHQGSTHLKNHEKAKLWLSAFRTNLAMTGVGLVERHRPPILADFLKGAFLDSVKQNAKAPATRRFYTERINRLCEYAPFTALTLDKITELSIQGYKESRLQKKLAIATINAELRCLRKAMLFAWRCKLCDRMRVTSLPGEHQRTFVLTGEMEKAYLAVAPYPLKQVAILMLDMGLRPEECVSLRKAEVQSDAVTIVSGKTVNARRSLPQTERTREVFELCAALWPDSPWVFPGLKGYHYSRVAIGNLHRRTCGDKFPREFVLYSLRHSFATRLAESGAREWDIMKLMGHSSIKISQKYIHPSGDHLSLAMKRAEAYGKVLRGESEEASHSRLQKTTVAADQLKALARKRKTAPSEN